MSRRLVRNGLGAIDGISSSASLLCRHRPRIPVAAGLRPQHRGRHLGRKQASPHSGGRLDLLIDWTLVCAEREAGQVRAAIETPHGPVLECVLDRGHRIRSINPKQPDGFGGIFAPAGAKDDRHGPPSSPPHPRRSTSSPSALRTDPDSLRAVRALVGRPSPRSPSCRSALNSALTNGRESAS